MKNTVIIFLGIIFLPGLSCKYHCDGFPDYDLKWIPYQIDSEISYYNLSDTFKLSIIDFYKSEPSSFRGLAMDIECGYNGYYQTTTSDRGYSIREELKETGYLGGMYSQITENDKFVFNIWSKVSYSDSIKVKFFADTIINQIQYQEVFLISKDTLSKSPRIAWIIKAKDKGIVEFYNFKTKQRWSLVDN